MTIKMINSNLAMIMLFYSNPTISMVMKVVMALMRRMTMIVVKIVNITKKEILESQCFMVVDYQISYFIYIISGMGVST